MFTWYDPEYLARSCTLLHGDGLSGPDRLRIEALHELETSRRGLRPRLAAALVRIGARLDPKTVEVIETGDESLLEGRLPAHLR